MRLFRRGALIVATSMLIAVLSPVSAAHATSLTCGQVITVSTVLTTDVGPCANNGIVIGADNITLNLGGHHVFGTPLPGDGAGVRLVGRHGVTVKNGLITDFDGGVAITGGGGNTVQAITAQNNIGSSGAAGFPDTDFGDGIVIEGSSNNMVTGNTTVGNGPFSGISLITISDADHPFGTGSTAGNTVKANLVTDNIACRDPDRHPGCDNDGIRLEPAVGPNNLVQGNTVLRNGLDGISLFADTDHNTVKGNRVDENGNNGLVPGDGIRIFGSANLITGNTLTNNRAGGVTVGKRPISSPGSLPPNRRTGNPRGKNNILTGNYATGSRIWDLYDSNPNCDNNRWRGNFGTKFSPACTQP